MLPICLSYKQILSISLEQVLLDFWEVGLHIPQLSTVPRGEKSADLHGHILSSIQLSNKKKIK